MQLSSFTQGKNNNFNLIRIIAALAVLASHSFALLGQPEPLGQSLGMSPGSISVDIFFIASGFLVTGSLMLRQRIGDYVLARVLRIFPALLVMLLLTVFGLGVYFTTLPVAVYLGHSQTYFYLVKCATLIAGVTYYLPGVFENNPYKGAVNGSLWTIVYEIKMYLFLLLFWFVCQFSKKNSQKIFVRTLIACAVLAGFLVFFHQFVKRDQDHSVRLFFMFFSGAAYWVLKEHIRLSGKFFCLAVGALLLAAVAGTQAFFVVYQLSIAYVLFYLAYVPAGWLRKYNAAGDYSYGVYIYAFPVQQSVAALLPGVSVLLLTLISVAVTLTLAALSWHWIEQRALRLKTFLISRARPVTPFGVALPPL